MAQNYIRQSSFTDGDTITAGLFNNEYNQLVNAFAYSSIDANATGHTHDGSLGQGGNISKIGDLDFLNKIEIDGTNNRMGFFVEVGGVTTEQVRISDGLIVPVTTNDIDLGSASLQFKDAYFNGNITYGSLSDGTITITAFVDEDDMTSNSATLVPTQQSVKAYVDAQVTAQDLDFQGDTGGALSVDLDSETLTIAGGTGIDTAGATNTLTVSIDSTVATLTGTQTLTNKTINADNNTVSNLEVDNLKTGVLDTDISSVAATHTTLPSALAVKTYVDAQVTAQDLDIVGDTGTDAIDLDSETLTFTGGTGITSVVTAGTVTHNIDSTVATLTGTQTLTNKTIDADNNTISNLDTTHLASGVLDTDLTTVSSLHDTIPSAKAVYDYVADLAGSADPLFTGTVTADNIVVNGDATLGSDAADTLTVNANSTFNGTVDIDSGTIDGTVIGGSTAAAGTFTSLTASGLTVDGSSKFSGSVDESSSGGLSLKTGLIDASISDSTDAFVGVHDSGGLGGLAGDLLLVPRSSTGVDNSIQLFSGQTTPKLRQHIASNGDISFYEDTGTTASLEWLAAYSALKITGRETSRSSGTYAFDVDNSAQSSNMTAAGAMRVKNYYGDSLVVNALGDVSFFDDSGSAKFYWDASAESLGIGTASPDTQLTLYKASTNADVNYAKMRMDSWGGSTGKLKSIAWDDAGSLVAAIGAEYDGSKTNIHFHSQYNGAFKGTSDRTMSIMGNGNVGIGTDSPARELHISKDGQNGVRLTSTVFGADFGLLSSVGGQNGFGIYDYNASGYRFNIDSTGNVGIGITPTAKLHVAGTIQSQTGSSVAQMYSDGGAAFFASVGAFPSIFTTNGTEAMRIDATGNVGIGTSSPQGPLHVYGGEYAYIGPNVAGITPDSTTGGIAIGWNKSSGQGESIIAFNKGAGATGGLVFADNNGGTYAERMRIDSLGRVGIGTDSPGQALSVESSSVGVTRASITNTGNAAAGAGVQLITKNGDTQVSNATLRTDNAGNFSIFSGTTSETERMRIDSSGTLITNHNIREQTYNLTGTDINPVNGSVQYKTLAANTTFTESLSDGDSVMLRLSGGDTYTVTWPTMTWVTSGGNAAPTLGGSDVVVLWQESSTVYGAYVGSYA